jgi:hypothetical protein
MWQVTASCLNFGLTEDPNEESAQEDIELAIDVYMAKPARMDVLVAMLAEKLNGRKKPEPPEFLISMVWNWRKEWDALSANSGKSRDVPRHRLSRC